MNYVGLGQWRDGLLMAHSSQLEESRDRLEREGGEE